MHSSCQIQAWLERMAPHITCAKCGAPVETVDLQRNPFLQSWLFEFRCHGKLQRLRIPYGLLKAGEVRSFVAFKSRRRSERHIAQALLATRAQSFRTFTPRST